MECSSIIKPKSVKLSGTSHDPSKWRSRPHDHSLFPDPLFWSWVSLFKSSTHFQPVTSRIRCKQGFWGWLVLGSKSSWLPPSCRSTLSTEAELDHRSPTMHCDKTFGTIAICSHCGSLVGWLLYSMGRAFSLVLGSEQTLAVIVRSACRVLVGKVVMRMSSGSLNCGEKIIYCGCAASTGPCLLRNEEVAQDHTHLSSQNWHLHCFKLNSIAFIRAAFPHLSGFKHRTQISWNI